MAGADPGCGISWNLLAGIGRIESQHANGGATDARGTAVRPIYGPTLDGTLPGNEVIVQSGAGGRVSYARAMGPMQFLPGTWARYASDGDGDGQADPQNLYDATLAAARYLCSGGLNLRDQSQVLSSILRYNNSMPYARNVLGWAAAYATGVVPVDLPPLTGPAPPLGDMHLENPEGIGPDLPLNIHGLPSTDPLAQMPLIDLGGAPSAPACSRGSGRPAARRLHGDLHRRRKPDHPSRRSIRRRPTRGRHPPVAGGCLPPRRRPPAAAAAPFAAPAAPPRHVRSSPRLTGPAPSPTGHARLRDRAPAGPQRAVPARIVADASPMVRLLNGPSRPASSPN